MKRNTCILAVLLATATFCVAEDKEEKTSIDKIPAKAAEALKHLSKGAEIKDISKEAEDGKTVFEAKFETKEGVREVTVDEAGKLISEEQVVKLTDTPAPVQKVIAEKAAGGKVEKVERVEEKGKTTFEALISEKGARTEYVFDPSGKVLETEKKSAAEKD